MRENNVAFEFTIAYFPMMNLNDLITVKKILCNVDVSKVAQENRNAFIIGFAHIKTFLDSYYDYLAIKYIDLAMAVNKTSKVPQSLLKEKMKIE